MQRRSKKLIKLIILSIFVLAAVTYLISWIRQENFQRSYDKATQASHKELGIGESKTIVLKNNLGADICLICAGYTDKNYIYSHVQDVVTNQKLAERIAKKIPLQDFDYLILVKGGRVVYVRPVREYSNLNVYDHNSKSYLGENILAANVGKTIKFTVQKVVNSGPLLITKIE
jgi:hypothetical protein